MRVIVFKTQSFRGCLSCIIILQSMSNQLFNIPKRPPTYINKEPKILTSLSSQSNSPLNMFPKAQPLKENTSLDNNKLIPTSTSNVAKTIDLSFSMLAPANKSVITLSSPLKDPEVKTHNPIVLPQTNLITNQFNQGLYPQTGNPVFNSQTGQIFPNAAQIFSNSLQNNSQQMWGNGTQNTTFFSQTNNQIGVNLGTLGLHTNQPFISNSNTNYVQSQLQPDAYNTNVQFSQFFPDYHQNNQYLQSPCYPQCPNYPQDDHYFQNSQDNGIAPCIMYPQEELQRNKIYNQIIAYLEQQVTGYQDLFKVLAFLALSDNCNDWDLRYFHPNQLLDFVNKFALMINLQTKRRREIEEYKNSIDGIAETNRLGYFRFDERSLENYYDEYIQSALESIFKDQGEICKIIQTNPALTKQIIDNRSNIYKYLSRKIIMNMDEFSSLFEPVKRQRNEDYKMSQLDAAEGNKSSWRERQHEENNPSDDWRACAAENVAFGAEWMIEVEEIDEEQRFRELMARY